MRKFLAVTLSALLIVPVQAWAQNCARVSHAAPVVVGNYGHGVQAFHGHHGYAAFHNAYVNHYAKFVEVVHPYAVAVAVPQQQYFSVAPELAYARINQEVAKQAAKEALGEFLQQLRSAQSLAAPATPGAPASALPLKDNSVASKMQAMVNSKCVSCHNNSNGIDLNDVTKLSRDERMEIVYRIMADPADKEFMPKPKGGSKGQPVTAEELNTAHAFVREAASNPPIPKAKDDFYLPHEGARDPAKP